MMQALNVVRWAGTYLAVGEKEWSEISIIGDETHVSRARKIMVNRRVI
jgi:hypothetical protein